MFASALIAIVLASVARAQFASLYPIGFLDGPLAGTAIGTGAEGTTYEIIGTFSDSALDIFVTMTLVEDATRVAVEAPIGTEGAGGFEFYASCKLGSIDAICTEVDADKDATQTVTYSGPYELVGVPVGTETASATSASSESVLPPSISVLNTRATETGATATLTGSSSTSTGTSAPGTGSGAEKNALVRLGLGVVGPAVLALLVTF